jgi:hypothetical protein
MSNNIANHDIDFASKKPFALHVDTTDLSRIEGAVSLDDDSPYSPTVIFSETPKEQRKINDSVSNYLRTKDSPLVKSVQSSRNHEKHFIDSSVSPIKNADSSRFPLSINVVLIDKILFLE